MSSNPKKVSILGVTGSVGQSTAEVILSNPELFDVHTVTAQKNVTKLAEIALKLNAKAAIIADESLESNLRDALPHNTTIQLRSGAAAIEDAASEQVDLLMAAIMGFAGLRPILSALKNGVNVAIANKEPLVAAGTLIVETAAKNNAKILPVDSEHNAIFQVFETHNKQAIDKIILTASGGPFLRWSAEEVKKATPEQAINHPNWTMGQKISVDSASMMNKALEIIEAHYLFAMPADKIEVLIHPQSIIHSMVSYNDGSILSQMGASDMRTPIANALAWPDRIDSGGDKLDISAMAQLNFEPPDFQQFPALHYAFKCLELGQGACISLNAANEVAVDQFLNRKISFCDIIGAVSYIIDSKPELFAAKTPKTVEDIEELDNIVRAHTREYCQKT